jgi:hypothetical protein
MRSSTFQLQMGLSIVASFKLFTKYASLIITLFLHLYQHVVCGVFVGAWWVLQLIRENESNSNTHRKPNSDTILFFLGLTVIQFQFFPSSWWILHQPKFMMYHFGAWWVLNLIWENKSNIQYPSHTKQWYNSHLIQFNPLWIQNYVGMGLKLVILLFCGIFILYLHKIYLYLYIHAWWV